MRVVAGFAAFLVLSGIPAVGQNSPPSTSTVPSGFAVGCMEKLQPDDGKHQKGSTLTSCQTTVAVGCPVDMRVRQRMGGATVAVDENGIKQRVFAQRLRLILNHLRADDAGRKVVSATVTVRGTGAKARMKPLDSGADDHHDLKAGTMVRTLNVDLVGGVEPGFSGDFLLPGFTSASRVDLESVTYDDGSTWKLSKNESCRVAPDPLMLIKE